MFFQHIFYKIHIFVIDVLLVYRHEYYTPTHLLLYSKLT